MSKDRTYTIDDLVVRGKDAYFGIVTNDKSKVYIDPLSELYLSGTTIDYINEDIKKNIYESKFIYEIDKNLMTSCGCGISFSPKHF